MRFSNSWFGPVQELLSSALGALFVSKKKGAEEAWTKSLSNLGSALGSISPIIRRGQTHAIALKGIGRPIKESPLLINTQS